MVPQPDEVFRRALAMLQAGQTADAERSLKDILRANPRHPGALNLLAIIAMQTGRFAEAEDFGRRAVRETPQSDATHSNYGLILRALGRSADAVQHFNEALRINSGLAETWNNRGVIFNDLKRYMDALGDFDRALTIEPGYAGAQVNKGKALAALRFYSKALEAYDAALAINPALVEAWVGRGNACHALKRFDEALAAYDKAAAAGGERADVWLGRGNVFAKLHKYDDALAAFDRAIGLREDLAEAWLGRGNVHVELKQYDDASIDYSRALQLEPDLAEAWVCRGKLSGLLEARDTAQAAFDKALSLDPELPGAWVGCGNLHLDAFRYERAGAAYDKAIALEPDFAEAWVGRGNVMSRLRRHDESVAALRKALSIDPGLGSDRKYFAGELLHERQYICDWASYAVDTSSLLLSVRSGRPATPLFPLLSIPSSSADQLRCAQIFNADKAAPTSPLWRGERYQHDRVRIAYISQDFREHPVGQAIVSILENHDRSRFEIIGISTGQDDGSPLRKRMARAVDQFFDVRAKSDLEVATLVRDLGVDIALTLAPHTDESRAGILAHRPAPIQVVGSSAWTSGADYLDYILADPRALPFDEQPYFSERIVHLPDSFFPYAAAAEIAADTPNRREAGLPDPAFVFCCFNRSYKLNPQIFDVWMRILKRVDGAVLWLMHNNDQAADNLRREARARDVDPARLIFASQTPLLKDHLARHRLADLFLDTLPYGAHTTAIDALYAGLPVLTCRGSTFVGRVSASMLHAVGLDDLVTDTLENYEEAAVRFAANPDQLRAVRDRLASNRSTQPLFDTARLCRHMEAAYSEMMERHRRGEPPAPFAVKALS